MVNEWLYSEINIFCIILNLIIGYKEVTGKNKRPEWRMFTWTVNLSAVSIIFDLLWGLISAGYIKSNSLVIGWGLNIAYFASFGLAGYTWMLFSESIQGIDILGSRKRTILTFIPILVLLALMFISIKTHWMFYVTKDNVYHRGNLYILLMIFSYGYPVVAAIKAFIMSMKKSNYKNREECRSIALFVVPPIVCGALQIFFPGVPMLCVGITIALFLAYIESQELLISIDPLTNINNRSQLISRLSSKMKSHTRGKKLYLVIMDVDYFKKINDTYGHSEGDRALITIASALKSVCDTTKGFCSRYGGDEFMVIQEAKSEEEIKQICNSIKIRIDEIRRKSKLKCDVKVSIGYAEYTEKTPHIPDLIEAADAELYKIKKSRK